MPSERMRAWQILLVDSLPAELKPNSMYLVKSGSNHTLTATDADVNTYTPAGVGGGGVDWGDIGGTLSDQTDLQAALDTKVDENAAITGATKTKITYDAKGLVTAGADATTADIADSSDKRYVTDAEKTKLTNTSGTNSGDQDLSSLALKATTISAGTGLAGGGDLSTNRTLSADFGTGAGKVCQGNDSRLSDARTPTAHTHPLTEITATSPLQCGRLTLTSGVPLPTSSVSGAGTVYDTPFMGDVFAYWDGSAWKTAQFAEIGVTLSGLTSGKNYDAFRYVDGSGVVKSCLGPAWTNDTTRATAVGLKNGVWVNSTSFTTVRHNSAGGTTSSGDTVAQFGGVLIGTIRTTGTATTELSDTKGFVCNAIHPRLKTLAITCAGGSHTYTTASFRPWANDSTNRLEWINTLPGLSGHQRVRGSFQHPGTGATALGLGVAVDSTTTADAVLECATAMTYSGPMDCRVSHALVGYHYSQVVERGTGTGSSSFFYANGEADCWL